MKFGVRKPSPSKPLKAITTSKYLIVFSPFHVYKKENIY